MKDVLESKERRPFLVPEGVEMVKIDYKTGNVAQKIIMGKERNVA